MNYQSFIDYLYSFQDLKYREGALIISHSPYDMIGVRTPVLRKAIDEHYLDEDLKLEDFDIDTYQEVAISFFTIGLKRCPDFLSQLKFLDKYVQYATGWAVADALNKSLKKSTFEAFFPYFKRFSKSKHTFKKRMGYVLGLKFARDKRIVQSFDYFTFNDDYMVMMGEAWLLCEIAIYHPDEVYDFLSQIDDKVLVRKSISKICDSYRFVKKVKDRFKSIRLTLK